ncbi:protein phosphatase 2C domain-containing protein [Pirellulales bacterium]|nr:protein phosphatase 2C domain-containing protein [Pirellulales bacterium]
MKPEPLAAGNAHVVMAADLGEPAAFEVATGVAAVWSTKAPDKTGSNEDAAAIVAIDSTTAVLVVADGCGGMAAGEVAARIAVESVIAALQDRPDSARAAILDGIEQANREVLDLGSGAGTTLAVALIEEGQVRTFHVGDSQITLVGGLGRVKLHTTAHSPVGYAVVAGMLDEQEAISHEDRHLVSNLIGTPEMHVEIGPKQVLAPRDVLLLCSDGLSDNLFLEEVVRQTRHGASRQIADRLGTAARERMQGVTGDHPCKPDDLTLIAYSRR